MTKKLLSKFLLALLMLVVSISIYAGEEARVFIVYDASNGLADNSVQIARCTKSGRVLLSTIGHINFFDGANFTHINPKDKSARALSKYKGDYQLFFDKYHHLWSKKQGKMTCVDLLTERFVDNVDSVLVAMHEKAHVDDFFADGECNMWFLRGNCLSNAILKKKFQLHAKATLQDVDLYDNRLLMLFHADGSVVVYDYTTSRFLYRDEAFTNVEDRQKYMKSGILCLVGHQYFQIRNSEHSAVLMRYDIQKRHWVRLMETPFQMNDLYPMGNDIYIASERGYFIYNILTEQSRHYEQIKLSKGRTMIPNINSLTFDRQGGLWLGTVRRGLLYSKAFPSPFKTYSNNDPQAQTYIKKLDQMPESETPLSYREICTYRDSRGWKWSGTYNGLVLELPDGKKQVFTRKDGFLNEVIRSIVEDDSHDIWVAGSYAITHIYIRDNKVAHLEPYHNQDDVPNEMFLNNRAMKLNDGTIVMQSIDHVTVFNPASFQGERFGSIVLCPKLVRLMVNGIVVEPGTKVNGREILDRSVTRSYEFHVNYNQNSLALTFSGLNYLRPIQTYYRVRVKGLQGFDQWRVLSYAKSGGLVDRSGLLHLPMLGLQPDKYVIEVQASLWPNTWPQEPFTWIVYVDQPWWRSTGIYVLLIILFFVCVAINFFLFVRNTRMRMVCLNEEENLMRRVRNYAELCEQLGKEVLAPQNKVDDTEIRNNTVTSEKFEEVMLKLVPYIIEHHHDKLTYHQLTVCVGMSHGMLYEILANHIDGSPRMLILNLRLQGAAELLRTTLTPIEEIANECAFVSPNFFISSFYHQYRMTPQDYRKANAL